MTDPQAPSKKAAGSGRWILLGCGVLTALLVLGMGGCAGIFYFIYQGSEPVAAVGMQYLIATPEMRKAFGPRYSMHRNRLGWNVQVVNEAGNARFTYTVRSNGVELGDATVWLVRSGGEWSAVGARILPKTGEAVTIGDLPSGNRPRIDWD